MIIGIDGNEANVEKRAGVNTYAFELLRNLWKLQDEWKEKHKLVVYLKDEPLKDMPAETQYFKYKYQWRRSLDTNQAYAQSIF